MAEIGLMDFMLCILHQSNIHIHTQIPELLEVKNEID